jgi:tetratricopeptide (TPR) repeat protein
LFPEGEGEQEASVDYLDFDLRIEPKAGGGYRVRVIESPAGEATGSFAVPVSPLELENFLLRMGQSRGRMRRLESTETQAAKTFGGQLYDSLFTGPVHSVLSTSLREARDQGKGLRIRMRLNNAPELCDLPWEYLYDGSLNRFLVLSKETPLVRFLEMPDAPRPLTVKPPLRVLVMISNPSDFPPLDTEKEWQRLNDALADLQAQRMVSLERLKGGSLSALQGRLTRGEYHVFHFVGHGGFVESAQDGALLMEDERGRGRPVSGQDLGTMLCDHRSLRLVILNACEGARSSASDPFAGTAQSIVQQGIPAVIAMQFEISDDAAIVFSHEFYDTIAQRFPVDAALTEARRAIFANRGDLEWGTPVLYMRSPDGRIFDIAAAPETPAQPPAAAPATVAAPEAVPAAAESPGKPPTRAASTVLDGVRKQLLAQLYGQALTAFYSEQWEQAVTLFEQVEAVQRGYEEAAERLAEARPLAQQVALFRLAGEARAAGDWEAATNHLQALVELNPDYPDAARQLAEIDREHKLADLYEEARLLHGLGQWQAVLRVFVRISALQPNYPDPDGLRKSARTRHCETLCNQAVAFMGEKRWNEAEQALRSLLQQDPAYRHPVHGPAADLLTAALRGKEQSSLPAPRGKPPRPKPTDLPH